MKKIVAKTVIEEALAVEELRIRSVEPAFYLLEIRTKDENFQVVDGNGKTVMFRSVEAARRACEGMQVSQTLLVHQSAYDEMIGMPGVDGDRLEMSVTVANPRTPR